MKLITFKCESGRYLAWFEGDKENCVSNGDTEQEAINNLHELFSSVKKYNRRLKTWHIELFVVGAVLSVTTFIMANDLVNWITTLAILVTFNHGIIGDRLQEKQSKMHRPTVECYYKLNRLFAAKEIIWIAAFLLMKNYAAIIGSVLFFLYPFWRKYYRRHIKPLK